MRMPQAEHVVDAPLVAALVAEQHPELLAPVSFLAEGWDTTLWRLGDELLVRLPRRTAAVPGCEAEQRWLPVLAPVLPLPVPAPIALGAASLGYPWSWSIVRHIPGTPAIEGARLDAARCAPVLGRFLAALHAVAPPDAPRSTLRGVPLAARAGTFDELVVELAGDTALDAAKRSWELGLGAPNYEGAPRWVHGDLHPGNVVVGEDGSLAGVLDFNDLNAGDPATDVAACWLFFDPPDVAAALERYGRADPDLVARAKGWVALFSLLYLSIAREGHAGFERVGRDALRRVAAQ